LTLTLERLKQDCGVRIVSPLSLSPTGLRDAVAIVRDCALFLASAGLSGDFLQLKGDNTINGPTYRTSLLLRDEYVENATANGALALLCPSAVGSSRESVRRAGFSALLQYTSLNATVIMVIQYLLKD
jgi:hypothetical protein